MAQFAAEIHFASDDWFSSMYILSGSLRRGRSGHISKSRHLNVAAVRTLIFSSAKYKGETVALETVWEACGQHAQFILSFMDLPLIFDSSLEFTATL